MPRFLRSSAFWIPFCISLIVTGIFFLWEIGTFNQLLPSLPRPSANPFDVAFTGSLIILLSVNAGLAVWQSRFGHCPRGIKRASGIAGLLGAFTLICPVCILLPASLIGFGFLFTVLAPFLPLLRIISVILLVSALHMLWPRTK